MDNKSSSIISRKYFLLLGSVLFIFAAFGGYVYGVYSYSHRLWPLENLSDATNDTTKVPFGTYDTYGRLTAFPSKIEVACPHQAPDTAVLLVMGQSNAANSGEKKFTTAYPQKVFNYFNGKCFIASSPLLGATKEGGEFITPLADGLIAKGAYKSIIIVSMALGGTQIARWQSDGDLNEMLAQTINSLRERYNVTDVIWHQGESDFINFTPASNYVRSFRSFVKFLETNKISAPIFIAIASKCGWGNNWTATNPTASGQRQLIDNRKIFRGADTDALLTDADRRNDGCHLRESGEIKTAAAFAETISAFHKLH